MKYNVYWYDGMNWNYLLTTDTLLLARTAAILYTRSMGRDAEIRWGDDHMSGCVLIRGRGEIWANDQD